ncbi:MAG: hypothetical protein GXP55_10255 [Deltaproteobacteria bacterium]|nr:hypothetical protein [Deltaproteobacteria bacterium]
MDYHCDGCGHGFTAHEARCPNCLKQTCVRVAADLPPPPGVKHLRVNAWMMVVIAGLSALSVLSVMLNLVLEATGHGISGHGNSAEAAGALGTFACVGVWALVAVVWTPINAWALFTRKPWARKSTLLFWAISVFTCGCIPVALYGLWSLTRDEVVAVTRGWTESSSSGPHGQGPAIGR